MFVISVTLTLSSCTAQESSADIGEATICEDPRSQICTREYRPVCGARDNGTRCVRAPCPSTDLKTYGNACVACADPAVLYHTPGACEGDE